MKNLFVLFVAALVLTGCKSRYDITLANGNKISGITKPKLDESNQIYKFQMPDGRAVTVPASRVRAIAPQGESDDPQFKNQKK